MSVTSPRGFRAAGVTAGLKASGRPDLALVVNDGPDHHAAAVFTSNRVEAAPVTWSNGAVITTAISPGCAANRAPSSSRSFHANSSRSSR